MKTVKDSRVTVTDPDIQASGNHNSQRAHGTDLQGDMAQRIAKLPIRQVLDLAETQPIKSKQSEIHENIIAQFVMHGSITESQADIMRAFLLANSEWLESEDFKVPNANEHQQHVAEDERLSKKQA